MRKQLMLLLLLSAIQCGNAQSPHLKFHHFTEKEGLLTGEGLGLSLTYDMVVKGHGGNITVDTKEQEYTEFTVTLPIA